MGIAAHIARLRAVVGHDLLLVPSVSVLPADAAGRVLLVRHAGHDDGWGVAGYPQPMTSASGRTRLTRLPEYGSDDRQALNRLLDEQAIGHVGVVRPDGYPVVVPTAIARDGDRLLIHGSTGSRWMRLVADGAPVCVEVTAADGVVVARSAFESSFRYRSAVLFGTCSRLAGTAQEAALDVLVNRLIPGRAAEVRRPSARELAATMALALPLAEWSLKVSGGWPDDGEDDVAGDAWAGVVPAAPAAYLAPLPAPDLRPGIPVPDSVRRLAAGRDE